MINTEEDMIQDVIMCNMRDKDTQKELWKLENKDKDLEEILTTIRANEAVQLNQAALSNQAISGTKSMKCYECSKTGPYGKDCRKAKKVNRSCGFCAGPKQCVAKDCKAINNKCTKCNKFGHYNDCCSTWTGRTCGADLGKRQVTLCGYQ